MYLKKSYIKNGIMNLTLLRNSKIFRIFNVEAHLIVTAWSNGKNGFGLKMSARDRDLQINKEWKTVILHLEGHPNPVVANIDKSNFWHKCPEFINKEIKDWLTNNNYIFWEKRKPPKFPMNHIHSNEFKVRNKSTR